MPFETLTKIERTLPSLRAVDLSANCEPLLNVKGINSLISANIASLTIG